MRHFPRWEGMAAVFLYCCSGVLLYQNQQLETVWNPSVPVSLRSGIAEYLHHRDQQVLDIGAPSSSPPLPPPLSPPLPLPRRLTNLLLNIGQFTDTWIHSSLNPNTALRSI